VAKDVAALSRILPPATGNCDADRSYLTTTGVPSFADCARMHDFNPRTVSRALVANLLSDQQ
jgi:hypothetical protein